MSRVQFTAALRKLRIKAGLTQQQLAEKAGVCKQTVSNYEAGRKAPALKISRALARVLGVKVDELGEP